MDSASAPTRTFPPARDEVGVSALVAAAAAALLVLVGPPGGDAAAHLYRTMLVREGVHVWDNLWYGGHFPLVSYSPLYYLPAAVVGNVPLVVAGIVVSAALFAGLVRHEWGSAGRWPSRAFGVVAAVPLFTGTYAYALGVAAALGALRLLQTGRTWPAVACAALALGFSPLAFVFLALVLVAVLLSRRRLDRRMVAVAGGLAALATLQLATVVAFPTHGIYPFDSLSLAAVLTMSALGVALARRAPRAEVLAAFFLVWGAVSLLAFFVPSPFGDNLTRLSALAFPLTLLTALLAGFRPRWLAVGALAFALAYNVLPYATVAPHRVDTRAAEERFWAPALAFLEENATPDYRVDVVPTFDHWGAYWVPRAGFALARGWYRQIDIAENPVLYEETLTPAAYRSWLRSMGVRYVLLPDVRLGPMGAEREAALLRSGAAGLVRVFASPDWTIYEVEDAMPLLTGPGAASIAHLSHERVAATVGAPGTYRLRIRYSPYWDVVAGDVCVERAAEGMTRIVAGSAGRFVLRTPDGQRDLVRSAFSRRAGVC